MSNVNHDDGETTLTDAIEANDLEMVKLLPDRGADVEKADKDGNTFRVLFLPERFASIWDKLLLTRIPILWPEPSLAKNLIYCTPSRGLVTSFRGCMN